MGYFVRKNSKPAVGDLKYHAGLAPPPGWIVADGSLLAIANYQQLYSRIGHAWALPGDDTAGTTFRLPGFSGTFLRSAGDGSTVGDFGGYSQVALTVDNLPDHTHKRLTAGNAEQVLDTVGGGTAGNVLAGGSSTDTTATYTGGVHNTTHGAPIDIIPPYQNGLLCIYPGAYQALQLWDANRSTVGGALSDRNRTAAFTTSAASYDQEAFTVSKNAGQWQAAVYFSRLPNWHNGTRLVIYWLTDGGEYSGWYCNISAGGACDFEKYMQHNGFGTDLPPGAAVVGVGGSAAGAVVRLMIDVDAHTAVVMGPAGSYSIPVAVPTGTGRFVVGVYSADAGDPPLSADITLLAGYETAGYYPIGS